MAENSNVTEQDAFLNEGGSDSEASLMYDNPGSQSQGDGTVTSNNNSNNSDRLTNPSSAIEMHKVDIANNGNDSDIAPPDPSNSNHILQQSRINGPGAGRVGSVGSRSSTGSAGASSAHPNYSVNSYQSRSSQISQISQISQSQDIPQAYANIQQYPQQLQYQSHSIHSRHAGHAGHSQSLQNIHPSVQLQNDHIRSNSLATVSSNNNSQSVHGLVNLSGIDANAPVVVKNIDYSDGPGMSLNGNNNGKDLSNVNTVTHDRSNSVNSLNNTFSPNPPLYHRNSQMSSVSIRSSSSHHVPTLAEEYIKNKYRQKIPWIVLLCIILTIHSALIAYLFIRPDTQCECKKQSKPKSDDDSDSGSLGTNDDNVLFTSTAIPSSMPSTPTRPTMHTTSTAPANTDDNSANIPVITNSPCNTTTIDPTSPQITSTPTLTISTTTYQTIETSPPTNPSLMLPSVNPTIAPSPSPTKKKLTVSDIWSVGDFKMSFLDYDHDSWLLCNGSYKDIEEYEELFNVIGYKFGYSIDDSSNDAYFQLPNVTNRVVGFGGSIDGLIGSYIGDEYVSLEESNLPSHFHYLMTNDECGDNDWKDGGIYLSYQCSDENIKSGKQYELHPNSLTSTRIPSRGQSGTTGDGEQFSVMQPTVFIGNVFIFAGNIN